MGGVGRAQSSGQPPIHESRRILEEVALASLATHIKTPAAWNGSLSGPPVLDKAVVGLIPALVRRWQGIDPDIDQSALDHHFVSIHLGGAKRLRRTGEGPSRLRDTLAGAHSVVPAGAAFQWNTEGPVDFAHFYFDARAFDDVIGEALDGDPSRFDLNEALGVDDPLIGTLACSVLDELGSDCTQRAYLDDLMHLMVIRLLRLHSTVPQPAANGGGQLLAPFRLRRAIDFIEANLACPIGVAEIAIAAGISAYHFSRAFRQATGKPPYAFLLDRRLERAKGMLRSVDASLTTVSRDCGFASLSQFSRTFRRALGVTPTSYRNSR